MTHRKGIIRIIDTHLNPKLPQDMFTLVRSVRGWIGKFGLHENSYENECVKLTVAIIAEDTYERGVKNGARYSFSGNSIHETKPRCWKSGECHEVIVQPHSIPEFIIDLIIEGKLKDGAEVSVEVFDNGLMKQEVNDYSGKVEAIVKVAVGTAPVYTHPTAFGADLNNTNIRDTDKLAFKMAADEIPLDGEHKCTITHYNSELKPGEMYSQVPEIHKIIEENFKGLNDVISDPDLVFWFKSLIGVCMESYERPVDPDIQIAAEKYKADVFKQSGEWTRRAYRPRESDITKDYIAGRMDERALNKQNNAI